MISENAKKLIESVNFEPNIKQYIVYLIVRTKDGHPYTRTIGSYNVKTKDYFIEYFDFWRDICDKCDARLYFKYNPNYYSDLKSFVKSRYIDYNGNNIETQDEILNEFFYQGARIIVSSPEFFIIDLDYPNFGILEQLNNYFILNNIKVQLKLETVAGVHIVLPIQYYSQIQKKFPNIGCYKQANVLVYAGKNIIV